LREEILWVPVTGRGKLSLNVIYAGVHWGVRKKQKDSIRQMVIWACRGVKPFSKPVSLTFRATLGKGSVTWDISNHGYLVKLVEDALVKKGILIDDTQKYVREIITQPSIRDIETGDGLWVRIRECSEEWWEP
jgi:Holliday junction resolvase RusA-like endonuclease